MMTTSNLKRILRDSLRIYFAPLVGAVRQMRYELRRVDRETRQKASHK